jgi:predicted O-methyltransferase YrrM
VKPSTIEAIKVLCDNSNPRHADGWCWTAKALTLCSYVEREQPKISLELGIFGGRLMLPLALQIQDNHNGGVIYGLDPWTHRAALEGEHDKADSDWWSKVDFHRVIARFMGAIDNLGLVDIAIPIRGSSQAVHGIFPKESIDFLSIDGNHSELASMRDIALYYPRVRSGGLICLDDIHWTSNKAAVDRLDILCETVQDIDGGHLGKATLYRKP